jgi:hypothetical protein
MQGSDGVVILAREVCGERTAPGGPLKARRSESTTLGCERGEQLGLANRLDSREFNGVVATAGVRSSSLYL